MRSAVIRFETLSSYRTPRRAMADAEPMFLPWLTICLLLVFLGVYGLEEQLSAAAGIESSSPTVGILVAMGGLSRTLLRLGEAYRMLTAPFLHGSLRHLLGNVFVFAFAGCLLERQAGRAWMFCIFAAGALAGSGMSLLLSAPATVSVGSSGAIMAMLAALFLISFRLPDSRAKTRNQRFVFALLIPALIPLAQGAAAMRVDYGAHFGGILLGALLGLLLLLTWPNAAALPALRAGASLLSAIALLAFASAASAVTRAYPAYEPLGHLMPAQSMLPPGDLQSGAFRLIAAYPRDPRAHLLAAQAALQRRNNAEAEDELRTALALADARSAILFPTLQSTIRATLASTVLSEGRRAEARAIAYQACLARGDAALPTNIVLQLTEVGLCREPNVARPLVPAVITVTAPGGRAGRAGK